MSEVAQTPWPVSDLRTSPSIAALAEALAAAQGEMKMPDKDREVTVSSDKGRYKFWYATMDNIVATTRPALSKHGLAVIQPVVTVAGRAMVLTRLMHKSGEWLESTMAISGGDNKRPQEFGSASSLSHRTTALAPARPGEAFIVRSAPSPRLRAGPSSMGIGCGC